MNCIKRYKAYFFVAGFFALSICCKPQQAHASSLPVPEVPLAWQAERLRDFDALWEFVRLNYAFFDEKATDWERVRQIYRPLAVTAQEKKAFLHVLERMLDELYDPHCMLNTNADDSFRPVPYDLFVEEREGRVFVTAVRQGFAAEQAGMRVGQEILKVDGVPISEAAQSRMPESLSKEDKAAYAWALLSVVAGRHADPRQFQVIDHGELRKITIPKQTGTMEEPAMVSTKRFKHGIGYLRIRSFGSDSIVSQVDQALEKLRTTRALIIDVRSNMGGDTLVARPIMGRFVSKRLQYAWMSRRQGQSLGQTWPEYVDPRGPFTYRAPIVILVDRFSVSMAEGFAMGMKGMKRAQIVGTKMAGLGAAIQRITLPHSQISAQISAEPVYHVDGTPRWRIVPDIPVEVLSSSSLDPILEAGQKEAERLVRELNLRPRATKRK